MTHHSSRRAAAAAALALAGTGAFADQALYEKAYIYGLPILMSYKTMYLYAVDQDGDQFKAPFNQIKNTARVYGPKDTAVVSANSDTPYSLLWTDLRAEPVVLCVPEIDKDRYFSAMVQDLSTNLLPYIGTRTTGNGGGCFVLAGPDWSGETPEGATLLAQSSSDLVFVVYRTQLFSPDDLDKVKDVQSGYSVQTLSDFAGTDAPAPPESVEPPKWDEKAALGNDFIRFLNFNLQFISPTEAEAKLLDELSAIGVGAGQDFDFDALDAEAQKALTEGVASAIQKIDEKVKDTAVLAGNTQEGYGSDWLQRAAITQKGWGANASEEASYPTYSTDADGDPLDGSKGSYTITFDKGKQPPVDAFWSITMYDAKTQLMVENDLDRYLLNSTMLDDMVTGADGSLTLYMGNESPGDDLEANWLPAPNGPFYMLMRLYLPQEAFLDGDWTPPQATKAK